MREAGRFIQGIPVGSFNRACLQLSLIWLLVTIPLGLILRPTWSDFSQFYMGGLIAKTGNWRALYPIPRLGVMDNPGLPGHSFTKSRWSGLRTLHGVPDQTRFILPPPSALLFVPLSFTTYHRAYWIWIFLQIGCAWGVAFVAGRLYRSLSGDARPSRGEGLLALLIVLSPMTCRSIRIANVSPMIAFLISTILLELVRPRRALRGATALLLGATLKYATLILAPLLLAMRRWKMLFSAAGLGALTLAATLACAGTGPFVEFVQKILPTLSRPSLFHGNQSLPGLLSRTFGRPLPPHVASALDLARLGTLALILTLLFTCPQRLWRNPATVLAGAALLLSWLLIFSPIAWEHWPIFLCPLWGWLAWEARSPGSRRTLAVCALALMYFPAGILQVQGFARMPILLPEPYNSTQLAGELLVFFLAIWRLTQAEPEVIPMSQANLKG